MLTETHYLTFKTVCNTNVCATDIKLTALAEQDMHVLHIPNSMTALLGINLYGDVCTHRVLSV